jgi:hypothetical protein
MEEKLYGRCKRCNRPLKTQEAQQRGYGPHCWLMHKQTKELNKPFLFKVGVVQQVERV